MHPKRDPGGKIGGRAGHQDDELVAAIARDHIASAGGAAQTGDAAKQALSGIAETMKQIDLVGSSSRAATIAEQIRQLSSYGPEVSAFCEKLLADVLEMFRSQRESVPDIKI